MKYTILSIGPIYNTLLLADNTRSMWGASYIFSYIMKKTIENLKDNYKDNFISPHIDETLFRLFNGAGLFHDRLIVEGELSKEVKKAYENAVDNITNIIIETFQNADYYKNSRVDFCENEVREFVKSYFQCYIFSKDVPEGKNPILYLSSFMDTLENQPRLSRYEEKEYLYKFLQLINLSYLKNDAFGYEAEDEGEKRCFKSFPEIAAWEFTKDWERRDEFFCLPTLEAIEKDDGEIYKALKEDFEDELKPYHKYIATVKADGDGFGKYLGSLTTKEEIKNFSEKIFSFAKKAVEVLENYGAAPVYAGGDDLFFFAPIVVKDKNIFDLIRDLDDTFYEYFDKQDELSVSYGVSISYYKFPLYEALEISNKALFEKAKSVKWQNGKEKNAICLHIRKHSGQSHEIIIHKDSRVWNEFLKFTKEELSLENDFHLPHSLHHSLISAKTILDKISNDQIEYFFTNQFNEDIHKVKHKKALQATQEILKLLKNKENMEQNDSKTPTEVLFVLLSAIKLLRGDQ